MPRFRYGLQPALDAALDAERDARHALARAEHAVALERAELARLDDQATHVRAKLAACRTAPGSVFVEFDARLTTIASARERRTQTLAAALRESAAARGALVAASQHRKAIERHRERRKAAFESALAFREAAEFDESNALAHALRTIRASS